MNMNNIRNCLVWGSLKVRIFAVVSVVMFTVFMMLFESYGYKPLFLLKTIEGKITDVNNQDQYRSGKTGVDVDLSCMELTLDSFDDRLISTNSNIANRFSPGESVKLWVYYDEYDYFFNQAKDVENNEMILKYNKNR